MAIGKIFLHFYVFCCLYRILKKILKNIYSFKIINPNIILDKYARANKFFANEQIQPFPIFKITNGHSV
jgi:hypothetical protein